MSNHRGPVPEWLTSNYMEDILRIGLAKPDLSVADINVTPGSNIGDNYACQIFRISVNLKSGETLSVIGKYKPNTKLLEELDFDVFNVEATFFESTLPTFHRISGKNDFAPKCIGVDRPRGIFFMEDLKEKGFQMQERGKFLNKAQCLLAVEALALMHGTSYNAIEQDSSIKALYPKGIWSSQVKEPIRKFYENAQRVYENNIDLYKLDKKYSNELLHIMDRVNGDFCKVCELQEGQLNFLLHGDAWMNNMMFHYTDHRLDSVRLLDFQIVNYNSFANDLQYFFFTSVETNIILNDLDDVLQHYCEKLRSIAPDIPNLTLDRVKSEFAQRYTMGYMLTICMRACNILKTPPDLDLILEGGDFEKGYTNPEFIADMEKLMPFFDKNGVFN